ncbi:methionine ABC transporter ATP-binding protein [Heliophilum fasciatum]|uniref:D-methionine transport system ATP-binding protein n=1 Tax=Heliophilum fasciatum TaxID=35700 RepID=A0A4R2RYV6_9FIRM|nr:ATP-binding cassette domain-containing protein [Heliophilum fasciatum]MCW2276825.1 D-methionine transport system ATP-binding protein [Heliophilum fasciatum]TCP68714.1 D-methionine transport system ATP-binding protein [Heliophilum fasciatum]
MIDIQDVSITFTVGDKPIEAVKNASIHVNQGEIFGIVGSSGAGKSTLLRAINLLQRPTAGRIVIDGVDVTFFEGQQLRELRMHMGMIFQQFNLIRSKTVFDNIAFAMKVAGASNDEITKRVRELLDIVGLQGKADAYPGQLSGGQKQRVGIARALANHPRVLLCDEPTSALDLETTNSILELLKAINRQMGITIVLITHEMDVVKKICDRVAVMSNGVVVENDTVLNVFAEPKHEFTRQLVNHSYDLDLPQRLLQEQSTPVWKIVYRGPAAEESVLTDTAHKFQVKLNILHGKIEYIGDQPLGVMLVTIKGIPADVSLAVDYIRSRVYHMEVAHE